MDLNTIKKIIEEVEEGQRTSGEALEALRHLPFVDLGICKHDAHRPLRNGFAEVILCEGKDPGHVVEIVRSLSEKGINVFGTRADAKLGEMLKGCNYDPISRTFSLIRKDVTPLPGKLAVICAGTADLPVAEEARKTAQFFGVEAQKFYDVGVAGLHRLLSCVEDLRVVDCAIVVAGMEGALPSVVGGLIASPIVAVPTSVGYGAHLKGFSSLLTMLNSCSEGITVVNIDNGFGSACAALRILNCMKKVRSG